jgi:hypothetical protein
MVMTYATLVTQVEKYLNRSDEDVVDQIPNFIYQAENRICRECKSIGLEVYVTSNFIQGVWTYQKPARWRRNITLNYGMGATSGTIGENRVQMEIRPYEYLVLYAPNRTSQGAPKYYSDYGYSNFVVAPTPDAAYPFEFGYLELPEPLTTINQTNWLTNFAADVLLYATLLEAIPFIKDDERIPVWESKYKAGLDSLNMQDNQRLVDRSSNREAD